MERAQRRLAAADVVRRMQREVEEAKQAQAIAAMAEGQLALCHNLAELSEANAVILKDLESARALLRARNESSSDK